MDQPGNDPFHSAMIPEEVEEYFSQAKVESQEGLRSAHSLIMAASPAMECRLVYGVPFYYQNKRICFLNFLDSGFRVGFCDGYLIEDDLGMLTAQDRKVIRHLDIASIDEKAYESLKYYLEQAVEIDRQRSRR
jgi:hypothetical protein